MNFLSTSFLFAATALGCSLGVSATAAAEPPVRHPNMGVQTHFGLGGPVTNPENHRHAAWEIEKAMPFIADLGVGWIRDDLFWNQYETERGKYQVPPRAMKWIDAANAAGLKIILIFNADRNNQQKLYPNPYDPEAYARAAAQLAKDLKGKIHAIEIINEPNNFGFMQHYGGNWNGWNRETGEESPWIAKYVELLNTAAPAIRKANPDLKIIGLGSPAPANFRKIAHGIHPAVDGIVDHPYTFRSHPELIPVSGAQANLKRDGILVSDPQGTFASMIRMYREQAEKYNGPQEIWLTEWGFPTHRDQKRVWYAGRTPEAQAKYNLRRFVESLGLGVEMSLYYDLKDDGTDPYEAEDNFGLLTYDLTPKPTYASVRALARLMNDYSAAVGNAQPEATVLMPDTRPDRWPVKPGLHPADANTIKRYFFQRNDRPQEKLLMLWAAERPSDLSTRVGDLSVRWPQGQPLPASARSYDLLTEQWQELAFEVDPQQPDVLKFKRLSIPDYPLALQFQTK